MPESSDPNAVTTTSCAGVMPAAVPSGWVQEEAVSSNSTCLVGVSDGNGVIAIGRGYGPGLSQDYESDTWYQYTQSGARTAAAALNVTGAEFLFGGPSGFQVAWQQQCNLGAPCSDALRLSTWHAGSGVRTDAPAFSAVQVPDPKGGMVIGGIDGSGAFLVQRFSAAGAPLSAPAHATFGPVVIFGFGASRSGPTLAVWDVHAAGGAAGTVRGRWLSATGQALTSTFVVATGAADGYGFDLVPLLDGSVAVRTSLTGAAAGVPPQFLGRFAPGSTTRTAVPGWLSTRPTAQVFPIRGAQAYALLFPIDRSVCGVQHVALFSGSGIRCGGFDANLGGSYTCVDQANVGRDGTLFLSGHGDPAYAGTASCKQRVVPALLR